MSRREEFNIVFSKIDKKNFGIINYCEGIPQDNRSLFISTILRAHDEVIFVKSFLAEIDLAENGQFQDMDDFWQPDSLTDSFRSFITPPNIKLGKDYDYEIPLQIFKELLQEWLDFLKN